MRVKPTLIIDCIRILFLHAPWAHTHPEYCFVTHGWRDRDSPCFVARDVSVVVSPVDFQPLSSRLKENQSMISVNGRSGAWNDTIKLSFARATLMQVMYGAKGTSIGQSSGSATPCATVGVELGGVLEVLFDVGFVGGVLSDVEDVVLVSGILLSSSLGFFLHAVSVTTAHIARAVPAKRVRREGDIERWFFIVFVFIVFFMPVLFVKILIGVYSLV